MTIREAQASVREFMQKAGQDIPTSPKVPVLDVRTLRVDLIAEEFVELTRSFGLELEINDKGKLACFYESYNIAETSTNYVESCDALGDLLVVILGTAVACGVDIEPIFEEVMRSNMTKFIDGYRREDGKWMKGPSYTPANIAPLIEAQL